MPFDPDNPPAKLKNLSDKKKRQWVGMVFGELTIVEQCVGKRGKPLKRFKCKCSCGSVKEIQGSLLYGTAGRPVRSCGCKVNFQPLRDDLTGQRFGRWEVVGKSRKANYWLCRCDCGVKNEVFRGSLTKGTSVSCGCWKRDGDWIKQGEEHHSWNPELTEEDRRKQKAHWGWSNRLTQEIFKRDDYVCQACLVRGGVKLATHHLDGWDWCKEKRFDKDNIKTLCEDCHIEFHRIFGYGGNTKEQYEEFLEVQNAVQVS